MRLMDVVRSTVPTSKPARYRITIVSNWQSLASSDGWSSQIFVAHGGNYSLWTEGGAASTGLVEYVQTDDAASLVDEINVAINSGAVGDCVVSDNLLFSSLHKDTNKLSVTSDSPLISMVVRLRLSNWFSGFRVNWFSGFASVDAVDRGNGTDMMVWLESFTVPIYPYEILGVAEHDKKKVVWTDNVGGSIGRVSPEVLGEGDYAVPVAYVEFAREKALPEAVVGLLWGDDPVATAELLGAAVVVLFLGGVLFLKAFQRAKRINEGYLRVK